MSSHTDHELDEILAYLEYIQSQNRLVSIVNTYKGVTFSFNVSINHISEKEKTITISTLPRQNMSLLPNTEVIIHSDLFLHPILSLVSAVDIPKRTAILRPLKFQRTLDESRTHTRVQVKDDISVMMVSADDVQIAAKVHDLSTNGMSILVKAKPDEQETLLQTGEKFNLSFKLELSPTSSQLINLQAKIIYVNPLESGNIRVGLETYPIPKDIITLRRYIFDQQTEFFREVSKLPGDTFP